MATVYNKKTEKVAYMNFVKGANQAISPLALDDNSLKVLNGANTSWKLCATMKDLGYFRVGNIDSSYAGNSILGLFHSRETSAVSKILLTADNAADNATQLFYNNAGTWTEITAAETAWNKSSIKVEFENFIGYCFMVGYGTTNGFITPASLTGTTFSTSTNVTSMPGAKYIRRYRDRLYLANCYVGAIAYPYRVYFSSVPAAGAITWTGTATTDSVDVDYSEQIMGIEENWDYLLIFTEYSVYYYNQSYFKKLWEIGTTSHRTLKNYSAYMLWANSDGVWVSSSMERPQNIAGNVIDFIRGASDPYSFFAEVVNEEYNLYIGSATVDGVAYSNVVLTFNFATLSWRWRELASNMTIFATYNSSGSKRLYMGDTTGAVWDKSKYSDATQYYADKYVNAYSTATDISTNIETKAFDFGDPTVRKVLKRVTVIADRALGVQLKMRVVDTNTRALSPYVPIGQLTKYINVFEGGGKEFNLVQFEFCESSKNPYFSILGLIVEWKVSSNPNISKK